MVNVTRGVLVECDPAMKQFLISLDEKKVLKKRFILLDLDETHVFIDSEIVDELKDKIADLMDQHTFSVADM
ncbi:General transcription factor IIH subunit 5 [Holothuria leucospilota]|uniref:General transcription and DNA repair factor IIH subunit TFB5 n=1 Tax=Holothuria leucospilota TaxID=206669 RepID=A0A9Q0YLM0_HOLLE|nr:General transcription factor IIH subunit 5 [Holothuria leucospilota]